MEIKFKPLKATDIEARVAQCTENGCSLLLYKDARCDMRMLDEVVGPDRWSCSYKDIKGNLFCEVGILTDCGWIYKQDVGIPSNMEAQKGEASDAFKRACFKWGIGRELYTAPFIWVPADRLKSLKKNDKGKWACYDRFTVTNLKVEDGRIVDVTIWNDKTGRAVFGAKDEDVPKPDPEQGQDPRLQGRLKRIRELMFRADELGFERDYADITARASFDKPVEELTVEQIDELGLKMKKALDDFESGEQ